MESVHSFLKPPTFLHPSWWVGVLQQRCLTPYHSPLRSTLYSKGTRQKETIRSSLKLSGSSRAAIQFNHPVLLLQTWGHRKRRREKLPGPEKLPPSASNKKTWQAHFFWILVPFSPRSSCINHNQLVLRYSESPSSTGLSRYTLRMFLHLICLCEPSYLTVSWEGPGSYVPLHIYHLLCAKANFFFRLGFQRMFVISYHVLEAQSLISINVEDICLIASLLQK